MSATGGVRPETRYARSGDVNIAYQVVGDGPLDLVLVPGFVSHLDIDWDDPRSAYFLGRLASFSRLIRFDKRGTGLSDRVPLRELPTLEERIDDVRAVLDAVASERAALFGYSEGGPMCVVFAATYPERTSALALYGTYAKRRDPDDDYPWAPTSAEREAYAERIEREWAWESDMRRMCPNADDAMARWWAMRAHAAASPGAARALIEMNSQIDVRAVLPTVHVPTVVLHRSGDLDSNVSEGRYLAERIPGARFVELPGADHVPWIDADQVVDEIEEFLTGVRPLREPDRLLTTVLFTDVVRSTERAAELGDRRWRDLLATYHAAVRDRLDRFRGREIDAVGDGFFASFDGPARAIRCAQAIRDAVRALGLELRTGLHTGECEVIGDKLGGIAVHIGARVAGEAQPGEILVSSTVKDLVAGAGIEFEDRGVRALKGVPGDWHVFAVRA